MPESALHLELIVVLTSLRTIGTDMGHPATHLVMHYSGSDEVGSVHYPHLSDATGRRLHMPEKEQDFICDWARDIVDRERPGWPCEDGSRGEIRIDLDTLEVEWVHEIAVYEREQTTAPLSKYFAAPEAPTDA